MVSGIILINLFKNYTFKFKLRKLQILTMDKKAGKKQGGEERKPRSVSKGDAAGEEQKKKRTSTSKGAAAEKKKSGKASATRSKSKGRQSSSSPAGKKGKASAGKGGKASAGKGGKASAGKGGKGAAKGTPSRSKSKGKGKEAAKEETKSAKKGKKVEKEDEAGKPTRALSAYIFYSNETIPKLKAEEGIAHKDAMGKAGQIWNTLSDDKKQKYNDLHDADVKR